MRVSKNKVNSYLSKELYKTLHQLVADLKSADEAREFLGTFLSPSEHETLAKRVAVTYWLDKGRGYSNIKENLKVSSATIAGTAENLNSKGVQLALSKIKAEEWANVWAERIKKFIK